MHLKFCYHAMKSPVLPVLKVELPGVLRGAGPWQYALEQKKEVAFFWGVGLCVIDHCMCNFDHSFLSHLKSKC